MTEFAESLLALRLSTKALRGLYFVSGAPWSTVRHGRFPIPRSVCWMDTAPLPIGKALTSMVLFPAGDGAEKGHSDMAVMGPTMGDEDAASWCHMLPTSIASSLPVATRNGALRCFLGVNVLLKKTRLTYVAEINAVTQAPADQKKTHPTEWLYTQPQRGRSTPDENTEEEEKEERLARCLARYAAMQSTGPSTVDGLRTTVLQDALFNSTVPEAVLYEAWRSVAMGRCAAATMFVFENVARGTEVDLTQKVCELANGLRRFFLTLLVELDWMTDTDNELLRAITLLLLGAVDTGKMSPDRREPPLRDGTLFVPHLTPNERRTMHWLLRHSELWPPLAAMLFAWVNQGRSRDEDETEILLEDVIQTWEEMNTCKSDGCCAFEDLLRRLRASQDAFKYQNALVVLLRGNLPLHETASLAVWNDVAVRDPSILFLQLLLEVAVACKDATATTAAEASISSLDISRIVMSVVQARFRSADTLAALLQLMHEWNFSFLEDWPLAAMSGGLPVVYLIRHITTADSSEAARESHRPIAQAAQVLLWLCGDCVERAAAVLNALSAAGVPLVALCFAKGDGRRHFEVPEIPLDSSGFVSGVGCNTSRALHHILASTTVSVLAGALAEPDGRGPTGDTTSEAFACLLWTLVLEGDEAAAFNPRLLQQLHHALVAGHSVTQPKKVSSATLLDFIRPVFLLTLPRLFAAVGNQHETVGGALAATAASLTASGVAALGPPLSETESIRHVWLATLRELGRLLQLHVEDNREVRCLSLLFKAFEVSSATLLAKSRGESEASTDGLCFTFSPAEMFFLSLQILSNEPARFVIAVEVMRRRLGPYLLHEMEVAIRRAGEAAPGTETDGAAEASNTKVLWWDSKAYLNNVAENLAMAIDAFENTAPLYAHALLLLFLDESLTVMADAAQRLGGADGARPLSVKVQSEMLQCTRHVALSRWAKLHRQEKKLIARVLSRHLSLPDQEQAEGDVYQENDVHHRVVADMTRMKEALQQRTVNAALLRAVRKNACRVSPGARSTIHSEGQNEGENETWVSLTDVALLLKEEIYVRQRLQRQLMRAHDVFVGSDVFRSVLGTLYLALREEQRRRVFVAFVREQHDIILTFASAALAMMNGTCRRGGRVLQQNALEHFQRQMRYLFLQERESRAAVEAVCVVERQLLLDLSSQQCAMSDAENTMRLRIVEVEEVMRDACYELFAKEEMAAQRQCQARLEEEAWREEEAQWALELQRRRADEDGAGGGEEGAAAATQSPPNAYLRWQQRHLAVAETKPPAVLPQPPSPSPSSSSLRGAAPVQPVVALPPASALAPLLPAGDTPATSAEHGGHHALLDASESLFTAFSRLQKQIISTVAPPPATSVKKNVFAALATAIVPVQQAQNPTEGRRTEICMENSSEASPTLPSSALQMSAPITVREEEWDDAVEDAFLSSTQAGNAGHIVKKEQDALDVPPKTHEDNSRRLRQRALAATGKRRAPRQRRLGEVVCLDKTSEETAEVGIARDEARLHEKEPQPPGARSVVRGDVALCAVTGKEASPSVEEAKPSSASVGSPDVDQPQETQTCGAPTEGDDVCMMRLNAGMPGTLKGAEEEEGEEAAVALALCFESSLAIQTEEGAARHALGWEERVARAFLFRYFTLEA
ncbi:hypothetical protein TRSC58_04538 [Trypanosoma rangeli SC58]|uniref:Uncharacterized protein n=1 Tax=Trypanosoma rangeli SC58 TaxID=429131 RepID=A0A061IYK5_TRYRA|nr:hypothetical protein TRSC58_04538 [Trypanosoma rangeli SC58]